jgi:hypothetical protein
MYEHEDKTTLLSESSLRGGTFGISVDIIFNVSCKDETEKEKIYMQGFSKIRMFVHFKNVTGLYKTLLFFLILAAMIKGLDCIL